MSVRKNAFIATLAVMGSRVLGLVREVVFAFFFGASPVFDAFIAAFRIPNLLRDLFSEGALSNAFVAVFSKKAAQEGDQAAFDLASQVFNFVIAVVGFLVVLGIIFSPWIVSGVASGFDGPKAELTVTLNRVLFPFILLVSLAAIAMGMLNTKGRFALPQSASTFFNLTSVVAGLAMAYVLAPEVISKPFHLKASVPITWEASSRAIMGMALGTLLGGLVQWWIQMPSLHRLGFRYRFKLDWKDPSLREVLSLTIPAIIGGAAVQVNVLVNTNFASYLPDGSISWLNYAFRLMQFPIGIFGVAIALATTPAIARFKAHNDLDSFKKTLRDSIQMSVFLCLPSALGLYVLAEPIIGLIYQYGQFNPTDTHQAALALQAYSVGLCFYALIKIYQPAFLVFNDAKTPMIISLISIGMNVVINWFLIFHLHWNHWGLALGTSLVAFFNSLFLSILLRGKIRGLWNKDLILQISKIALASCITIGLTYSLFNYLNLFFNKSVFIQRIGLVFAPIFFSLFLYALLCYFFKVNDIYPFLQKLQKRLKK